MSIDTSNELETKIPFPHDRLFGKSLQNIDIAKDFFSYNLPPRVLNVVDLNTLALEPDSFVKKDGRVRFKDLVYGIKIKDKPGRLFTLWEHQSKPD